MKVFSIIYIMILSVVAHCQGERPYEDLQSSSFSEVVKNSAFVDKSLLIKEIFNQRFILVTAPPRFGKSTNLDMLRHFLSIPLNPTEKENRLQTFQKLKIYKELPQFVKDTFGKYPVLYVDFTNDKPVHSYDNAIINVAEKVHNSFKIHSYLLTSKKLNEKETNLVGLWCDGKSLREMSTIQIQNGLSNLASCLYKHYNNSKVFVLIDAYDSLISNTMYKVGLTELNAIIELYTGQVSKLVQSNNDVERAVITGVSYIAGSSLTSLVNLHVYKFLDDHSYVDFYGFTEGEVTELFKRPTFNIKRKSARKARRWYGGYLCKSGKEIYNPFSILTFLRDGKLKCYWTTSNRLLEGCADIFEKDTIRKYISQLIKGQSITFQFVNRMKLNDLIHLKSVWIKKRVLDARCYNIFLTYLFQHGYLTFNHTENSVLLPNREIQGDLQQRLEDYTGQIKK